jgi:hypothetical protein
MAILAQPSAVATAPSTLTEQSISASLTAETMRDLDDGQTCLLASTHGNHGDLQVVTASQLLAKVTEQRAQLDRIEALANEYAAHTLDQFVEYFDIELIETPLTKLTEARPDLAARLCAVCALKDDGTLIVAVPAGQSPVERLAVVRELILDLQSKAAQA